MCWHPLTGAPARLNYRLSNHHGNFDSKRAAGRPAKSISKDFFDSPRSIQHSLNYLIDQKLITRRRVKGGHVAYWHH